YIKNSDIDYQSYWREATRMKNEDGSAKIADAFIDEGPNPKGADSDLNVDGTQGFNSVLNCSGATTGSDHSSDYNVDESGSGRFILENYKYQFIFPGNTESGDESNGWQYNAETKMNNNTDTTVHLNCRTDFIREDTTKTGNQQNIYDDDPYYGRGPKAFSGTFSQDILWTWDYDQNSVKSKKFPLILVNSQGNKRYAFKYGDGNECVNGVGCVLFLEMEAKTFTTNGIANSWKCVDDFECPETLTGIIGNDIKWQDITPENLIVTQFDFYLGPEKKSDLSFNQPLYNKPSFITLKLGVKSRDFSFGRDGGRKSNIEINLQSTIIPRNSSKTINVLN
ncbi:hypothetical protein LR002_00890, partial [Candidatus Gracilibacteria bacterium]|nr:hypothetical protein [Candidatus Gracilibacteria bacterium]